MYMPPSFAVRNIDPWQPQLRYQGHIEQLGLLSCIFDRLWYKIKLVLRKIQLQVHGEHQRGMQGSHTT
jgi:hypothetical protein